MSSVADLPLDYVDAYTGRRLIIANTIILFVATLLLALRLYVRTFNTARGWDDYLLGPSWLLLVALGVVIFVSVFTGGVGRHVVVVIAENPKQLANLSKLVYILDWFYVPSNTLSRISVVLMYLRIFTNRWARFFCWATIVFLSTNCVATIIAAQVECKPLAYLWDKTIPGGKCFDTLLWWRLVNIPNIVADVAILLLPVRTIWSLRASTSRRAGISITCLAGSLGMIASIVRTIEFFKLDITADPTWFSTATLAWTVVECGMYNSAACLIGLRPLLTKAPAWAKRRFGSCLGKTALWIASDLRANGISSKPQNTVVTARA